MTTPDASASPAPCPMTRAQVVDAYFMEHRAKLIDIAAFLDRIDRAVADTDEPADVEDYRVAALRKAMQLLTDGRSDRARRVLELLSDPTTEPIPAAPGKGAAGAWKS